MFGLRIYDAIARTNKFQDTIITKFIVRKTQGNTTPDLKIKSIIDSYKYNLCSLILNFLTFG